MDEGVQCATLGCSKTCVSLYIYIYVCMYVCMYVCVCAHSPLSEDFPHHQKHAIGFLIAFALARRVGTSGRSGPAEAQRILRVPRPVLGGTVWGAPRGLKDVMGWTREDTWRPRSRAPPIRSDHLPQIHQSDPERADLAERSGGELLGSYLWVEGCKGSAFPLLGEDAVGRGEGR